MMGHVLQHPTGLLHLIVAVLAIVFGTAVVLSQKGTSRHKLLGRSYFVMMIATNVSAFLIYEVYGRFALFHWMALFSLLTVVAGYIPARTRKPFWRRRHAYFMSASYVGLLAALAAEILTRTPWLSFIGAVSVASTAVIVVGLIVMFVRIPRLL
jgi:uncharacterized membrane protein